MERTALRAEGWKRQRGQQRSQQAKPETDYAVPTRGHLLPATAVPRVQVGRVSRPVSRAAFRPSAGLRFVPAEFAGRETQTGNLVFFLYARPPLCYKNKDVVSE